MPSPPSASRLKVVGALALGGALLAGGAAYRLAVSSEPARGGLAVNSASARDGLAADSEPRTRATDVLLITVDTLRADRLGAYGWRAARTPALDALARRGTRFSRAYATAPITLPSHATLLTGRYPPGHGARHNGLVANGDAPSIAEALSKAGFETGAFVSAFPLDRRFGLARGFDAYDDHLPRAPGGAPLNERPGSTTVDRAVAWLRARPATARVFMWVHLFEPHAPYAPGAAPGRSAEDRYDDEVAAADREIARLLDAWRGRPEALVVATADHGEAFGEHGERGHSIFLYDTTLRVPLIVAGPGVAANATIDAPVTLADVAPTLARRAGLQPFDADGAAVDLHPGAAPPPARALYAESFAPLLDFGWAPLRSLRHGGLKLIAAPRPELYDLAADAAEQHNVIDLRVAEARGLAARVDRIAPPELPARAAPADREALERLRSLGYLGAAAAAPGGARPDPKDRIAIASRMAAVTSGETRGPAAERSLRDVLREDPGNPQAHLRLGVLMADTARCADAERHFAAAIAARLPTADPHIGLARCQAARGATAAALASLDDARRAEPGNPIVEANVGMLHLDAGRADQAVSPLRAALAIDPDLHQARFALARALARTGQRQAALDQALVLLERVPAGAPQRPEIERLVAALR